MTKAELIKALNKFDDDICVIVMNEQGIWSNIGDVRIDSGLIYIEWGDDAVFSSFGKVRL